MRVFDPKEEVVSLKMKMDEKSVASVAEFIKRQNEEWIDQLFDSKGSITLCYDGREVTLVPKGTESASAQIRCKNCVHSYEDLNGRVCTYGPCLDCFVPSDFFCAEWKKMEV